MDIETLIEENSSEFEVAQRIKEEIKNYIGSLSHFFEIDQGKHFLVRHTKNIDTILTNVYKYTLRKNFKEYLPLINAIPITIVAMGSYGREQLCVYSDIDLLIVYKEIPAYNTQPIIESFLQILWDSGLKLGHRVHEVDTLFDAACTDHTIKTALLESRFIYGSKYLWYQTEHVLKRIRQHEPLNYIREKLHEREEVIKKYPFNMQPDIKNAPGGLRDANLLFWIAKILHNITKIKDLPSNIITDTEYKELMVSLEFLFRVRSALHLSSDKKNDRLILELIPSVGEKLKLTQTRTVQKTFEAMHHIRTISSIIIKRLTHTLFFDRDNITLLRSSRIGKNHYFCDNIHYSSIHAKKRPLLDILETLIPFANETEKFDISFISLMKFASFAPLDKKRLHRVIKNIFYKEKPAAIFEALYQAHYLWILIAPLRKVAYLPQFDGYHSHPVDLHSIYTLKALENISDERVKAIYDTLDMEQKALLRLTAFLHDSGKGRKKDHSLLGAAMIKKYALTLGFSEENAQLIYTLILYHTLMSNTAHREDIYSEKVIFAFVAKLKTKEVLDLLYILTYADIASVSKSAYSANNARLLYGLYKQSIEAISNKTVLNEAAKRNKIEKQLRKNPIFIVLPNLLQKKIFSIESNLFFFKFKPEEIIEISQWVYSLKEEYCYKIHNQEFLSIEIIRRTSVNLGYILSRISTLNVVNMDIFNLFNGIKYFRIDFDESIPEEELFYVKQILDEMLIWDKKPKLKPVALKPQEIAINCNHSKSYAKMKIVTKDQKGLMANIMTLFDDIGIDIASAKIQTIKNRARNLFLIEKNGNFCTNKELVIETLTTKQNKG